MRFEGGWIEARYSREKWISLCSSSKSEPVVWATPGICRRMRVIERGFGGCVGKEGGNEDGEVVVAVGEGEGEEEEKGKP